MAKLLILLSCLIGLAAAGVVDTRWMRGVGYGIGLNDWHNDVKVGRKITHMTDDELFRQKVLLQLLDHVHDTLNDVDLLKVRDEFVTNAGNYQKGFDDDMLYVVELQRSGRLLGKRDVFTVSEKQHRRQMVGLKRLLSRAVDFETFVQNAVTARNHMNGVLFVNALLLAVRERNDTRQLIVPALHDILPELYIDGETLSTLGNIDIQLLTTSTGFNTMRPNLLSLIGGGVYGRNDHWGQLGKLVTHKRNYFVDVEEKIVIDEVNKQTKDRSLKLLTDDVDFKAFWHQFINDLCLKENEIEKEKLWGRDQVMGYGNRIMGESMDNGYVNKLGYHGSINVLSDGRDWMGYGKNLNTWNNWNTRNRFNDVLTHNNFNTYVPLNNNINHLNTNCLKCIDLKSLDDCLKCKHTTEDYVIDQLDKDCKVCIRVVDDYACDKCKVKLNHGSFNVNKVNSRDHFMDIMFRRQFDDGRHTKYTTNNKYVDELNLNRLGNFGVQRLEYNDKPRVVLNAELNVNDFGTFGVKHFGSTNQYQRNFGVDFANIGEHKQSTNSEVLLHNLKQILARINLERISLGLDTTDDLVNFSDEYLNLNDYSTNNVYGVNHGVNQRVVEHFVDIINEKIVKKIQNGQLDVHLQDFQVDRVIARTLLDPIDGDVNLVDILSNVMVKHFGVSGDMQIVRELGDILEHKQLINVLRQIIHNVDNTRSTILGSYQVNDIAYDDVKINNVIVDQLITSRKEKDIDVTNLMQFNTNDQVVVVRQKQLTHKDFDIKIDVDSKRNQRVVVRTLIGPKGQQRGDWNLNERRLGFMLLDTTVVDLVTGRNLIQCNSLDLFWTKRGTTTLSKIYKRIMGLETFDDVTTVGQDCRFPQHLILPRGRVDGLNLELLVVITPYEGAVVDVQHADVSKQCTMGISVKGVDSKSLGFPLDRHIDFDIRMLNNVVGVDIKVFDEQRQSLNWW